MKLWQREGESKLEKLIEKIENHPLAVKIREEEATETLSARQQATKQIEALKSQQAESLTRLQAEATEKERAFNQARTVFEIAGAAFNQARGALRAENLDFERQIGIQAAILIESADPLIDQAIEFFREKLDWLRAPGRFSRVSVGAERNLFTETVTVTAESNKEAILSALTYCQQAVKALELMKLEPELNIQGIERMKSEIPSIDTYTESTGVKPMPGSKGVNPLHLLKSDSQLNWEIGKLNEKFKKVMSRKAD